MNVYTARALIIDHRLDYNRDRLPWLPSSLYRLFAEAVKSRRAT